MELALFGFSYLLLLISIFNYFSIRIPKNTELVNQSVTVLLPVRNEEQNIEECVRGLTSQESVPHLRFIIIDDQSSDKTAELVRVATKDDSRFSIINSDGPRPGWLGKVSALQRGCDAADSEFIITLDADVRLQPSAIALAVNQLEDLKLDFISPYPRQESGSLIEKLIQPLLHWSWMTTVILRLAEKVPHRSTAVANGQFLLVRKKALDAIGGFTSVQSKILDDIEIARSLIAAGHRGVVTEGSAIAQTRMYRNFNEIKQGYGKSLHKAFGGALGGAIAIAFIFITGVLPVVLIFLGSPVGWFVYLTIVSTRALSAVRAKSAPIYAFLHPISSLILIYLITYSWNRRGAIQWKGRTV